MSASVFPLAFATGEVRLLTAIVLGFLFGFVLERAGFGNARKLAAQFYLYDMTVFKVMFTAILVAMVGFWTLARFGAVDPAMVWINPTFLWAQLVGGFVLGMGFILSGLCPGTSVVSAASGRWDSVVTFGGIFAGTFLFTLAVDLFPALERLYGAGSMDVSLLPDLLGADPLSFALGVVVAAGLAFVGAEKVEEVFRRRHGTVELTPAARPRMKLAVAGTLAAVAAVALALRVGTLAASPAPMASVEPLALAERIIEGDPTLMVVDLREGEPDERIPGSYPAPTAEAAAELLASAPAGTRVVVVDRSGTLTQAPPEWPDRLDYRHLAGGFSGWEFHVLTPMLPGGDSGQREAAARQNQISAYFTGAAVQSTGAAPPPVAMPAGGGAGKKKGGGC